jgi:hypothetical protein
LKSGGRLDLNGGSEAQISFLFDEMYFPRRDSPLNLPAATPKLNQDQPAEFRKNP